MTALRVLALILLAICINLFHSANAQTTAGSPLLSTHSKDPAAAQSQKETDAETAAINALYGEWIKATATRGADGYVSFFVADAAVIPPGMPAVEGKDTIRQWIQKELEESSLEGGKFVPGPLKISNGWAVRRFSIAGKRVPKKGGEAVSVDNKYLDVLQKQADGSWKFVYRMWNSNQ